MNTPASQYIGGNARRNAGRADQIRGVLIQVAGARLLVPNAAIAEVLSFADPVPVDNTPDWMLGRIRWRGWQLPLIAFSSLAGIEHEQGQPTNKVVVLKTLGGDPKAPYFSLLTQGFPRLVTVSRTALVAGDDARPPPGVRMRVILNEDDALVPDLEVIEAMIGKALAKAA